MRLRKVAITLGMLVLAVGATVFAVRAYDSLGGPPLAPWHTFVPDELSIAEMDATDWSGYLAAEDRIFRSVEDNVTRELPEAYRVSYDRYFSDAPIYPGRFPQDFNRSYILAPEGEPKGAALLLHGLTDAPYSLRHVAELYRAHGFVAVVMRMPGHGTVPAGLTEAVWEDWMAATRLGVRESVARAGAGAPLHIVGYSNGGALAVKYALDALSDDSLAKPDRLVLLSPMIGVTRFARFSGLASLPAIFPAFVKAAWLNILPEYNPFKYNSFPVNAARQTWRLTSALQSDIEATVRRGEIGRLPPILSFQSAIDFTVSARAVVRALYDRLEDNGSELVLFDVNRAANVEDLLRPSADTAVERLLPPGRRKYRATVIANAGLDQPEVIERTVAPGETNEVVRPLGVDYPADIFSMSHIALPFPPSDGLYGSHPSREDDTFGVSLGTIAPRGETGALIVGLDSLLRVSSNPFYAYVAQRIEEGLPAE
jgi:alpha-beta hydrolase superfamily lysophospholipase